jgi:asparagine synthase (glutamine-hydrolysing)
MFDVQRSDRSISSHGLEPRTPFLDKTFVQTVLQVPLEYRQPTAAIPEKWILRRAFDDGTTLPREVLWRRKEAFSDGVSGDKPWYLLAQEMATRAVDLEKVLVKYVHNPPVTPEMCYYRGIFEGFYPGMGTVIPYMWMPLWSDTTDPSARTLKNY